MNIECVFWVMKCVELDMLQYCGNGGSTYSMLDDRRPIVSWEQN